MLLAVLQAMFKFTLTMGAIFGLAFMVICTVLVIVCAIRGDIRINITRSETKTKTK